MSKFMLLGFFAGAGGDDDDHGAGEDHQPRPRRSARWQIGAPADVAIMGAGGRAGVVSSIPATTSARARPPLKPVQTVINGVPFGRPYQAPFAVR